MLGSFKEKFQSESKKIKEEARNRTIGYILAGFSLVAGLAWNDAIKQFIETTFALDKDSVWAKFVYAILITLVVVIVSIYLNRLIAKEEPKGDKPK